MVVAQVVVVVLAERKGLLARLALPVFVELQEVVYHGSDRDRVPRVERQPKHIAILCRLIDNRVQQVVILVLDELVLEPVVFQPQVVRRVREDHPRSLAPGPKPLPEVRIHQCYHLATPCSQQE